MPNQWNFPVFNKLSNHFSAAQPTRNDDNKPAIITSTLRGSSSISIAVRNPAPAMAGMANKNENLAASSAVRPIIKPVQIVAPERDIPGIMANAWAKPILNPFTTVKSDFVFKNHLTKTG